MAMKKRSGQYWLVAMAVGLVGWLGWPQPFCQAQVPIHVGKLSVGMQSLDNAPVDTLVVILADANWQDLPFWQQAPAGLRQQIDQAMAAQNFMAQDKEWLVVAGKPFMQATHVVLLGIGRQQVANDAQALLAAVGQAVQLGKQFHSKTMGLWIAAAQPDFALVGRAIALSQYRFNEFRKDKSAAAPAELLLLAAGQRPNDVQAGIKRGMVVAHAEAQARDWVNQPPNLKPPALLAQHACASYAKLSRVQCRIYDANALDTMGMRLLLAVGQGSRHPPHLVHATYRPSKPNAASPVVLVGKGITFDTGGLALKNLNAMSDMKIDMAGAAAVLATLQAVAVLQLPIEVHALAPLAENMLSATAVRPSDIVTSRSGLTVEINNPDAEGRLVLADALDYAKSLKPAWIIDVATLTGACVAALGSQHACLFGNHQEIITRLERAAQHSGENVWQLPLIAAMRPHLRSDVADLSNAGPGGAIIAALFLEAFVPSTMRWAHLDIAGPATTAQAGGIYQKGATGMPVATLVEFLSQLQ